MIAPPLLAIVLAAASAAGSPPEPSAPWLSRPEPSIGAGAAALARGDTEGALELFRKAKADTPDQRAIVEYDVGQAMVAQAIASATPTPTDANAGAPPGTPPGAPPAPPQLDKTLVGDAQAAFARARGLAHDPRLKAEAALAAGNLAAVAGDVDEAIAQYRQALRDDPQHERARKNLRRALEAKKQQPPQDQGGDKQPDDDKKNDDKKNDDKKNDDKKDDDKKDDDKKDDDKKEQEQTPQDPKDGDKKDQDQDKKDKQEKQDPKDGDKKDQKKEKQEPAPAPGTPEAKKAQKKEAARRLLDALRARERPLTPLEMRGAKAVRAKEGKDW